VGGIAPTLWLTRGYAVLDGPTFPIIAEGEGSEPNDTYIEQLTASARVGSRVARPQCHDRTCPAC
jgi:hypothetical protein